MSTADDILFSPIAPPVPAAPNWRNVPIYITYISPSLITGTNVMGWQGGGPSPGIHYTYPEQLNQAYDTALKDEIYAILENCLSKLTIPYGATHTVLKTIPQSRFAFDDDMRTQMYHLGVNPISNLAGYGEILWEQKFADRDGNVQHIVMVDPNTFVQMINPVFVDLAVNPVPPLP